MNFFLILSSIHFLVFAFGLWLAFWVYFAGKKKKLNKYFFLMVIFWIFGEMTPYFIFRNIVLSSEKLLFLLPKLNLASVFIFLIFFYFFFLYFLREEKKFPLLNIIVPFIGIIGAFLSIFTNLFQKKVEITKEGLGLDLILTTEGKFIWLGFIVFLSIFIFIRFLKNRLNY